MGSGTRWRVWVLVGLALGALVSLLVAMLWGGQDWAGLVLNLGSELAGAAVTYVLLELVVGHRERKADLIAQMGSQVPDDAIRAVEELRRHGWLFDGSLQGVSLGGAKLQKADLAWARLQRAYLEAADLQGADLHGAKLQGAYLALANLQGADLSEANLQKANLSRAKLQGALLIRTDLQLVVDMYRAKFQRADLTDARLEGANLQGADLQGAHLFGANLQGAQFDERTVLPDGTKWALNTDMARFTDPKRPDF